MDNKPETTLSYTERPISTASNTVRPMTTASYTERPVTSGYNTERPMTTYSPDTTVSFTERPMTTEKATSYSPETTDYHTQRPVTSYSPMTTDSQYSTEKATSYSPMTTGYHTQRPMSTDSEYSTERVTSYSPETTGSHTQRPMTTDSQYSTESVTSYSPETSSECDYVSAERICEEEIGCDCCTFNKNDWLNECKEKVCSVERRCLKRGYNSVSECCMSEKRMDNQFEKICQKYCSDEDMSDKNSICDEERANQDCVNNICGECMGEDTSNYKNWLSECSDSMCKWNKRCDKVNIYEFSECMDEYEGIEYRFNRIYKRNCISDTIIGDLPSEEVSIEETIPDLTIDEPKTEESY
jgi:hypothetical protein